MKIIVNCLLKGFLNGFRKPSIEIVRFDDSAGRFTCQTQVTRLRRLAHQYDPVFQICELMNSSKGKTRV